VEERQPLEGADVCHRGWSAWLALECIPTNVLRVGDFFDADCLQPLAWGVCTSTARYAQKWQGACSVTYYSLGAPYTGPTSDNRCVPTEETIANLYELGVQVTTPLATATVTP
jgi:hypothetical protein